MSTVAESTPLHEALKQARRSLGITQSALAETIGCRQSAISMFESGNLNALAWPRVAAMADALDVDLATYAFPAPRQPAGQALRLYKTFCPNPRCPSNVPYMAGSTLCLKPRFVTTCDGAAVYCSLCGEVLETRCPNPDCRAAIHDGAFCGLCGTPYVAAPSPAAHPAAWVTGRRRDLAELAALTAPTPPVTDPAMQPAPRLSRRDPSCVKGEPL